MAVENDYNALVFKLNDIGENVVWLVGQVDGLLLEEKRDRLEPNKTDWVNLIAFQALGLRGDEGTRPDGQHGAPQSPRRGSVRGSAAVSSGRAAVAAITRAGSR